jgi:hypothetical protein
MTRFFLIFFTIFFILPLLARLFFSLATFLLMRNVGRAKRSLSGLEKGDVIDVSGKVVK